MLQKSKKYELLGWPVFEPHRLTKAQQVYDILCREIQSKRWLQGEKLPSIGELANESGLGQRPIRQLMNSCVKKDTSASRDEREPP